MTTSDRPVRRAWAGALTAAIAVATGLSGCSASLPPKVSDAPALEVVTGLYPLARAASLIGQEKVAVTDVVPPGANPLDYQLTAAQVTLVHRAGLAVEVGGGFQPSFGSAATGARSVVAVGSSGPDATGQDRPYVWLDPASMGRAVATLASAMERADPAAAPLYRQNEASLQAQISSLGIDYSSVLTTCPHPGLVAPDKAFAALAASYHIRLVAVGSSPSAALTAAAVQDLRSSPTAAVIAEPWVDDSGVTAVAAAASTGIHPLDTLAGPPSGGWPRGADYFALMEQNLGTLSSVLGCASSNQ